MADRQKDPRIIDGAEFGRRVAEALGIHHARRIIIDCQLGEPLTIHVELFGDERLLDIRLPDIGSIEIVRE